MELLLKEHLKMDLAVLIQKEAGRSPASILCAGVLKRIVFDAISSLCTQKEAESGTSDGRGMVTGMHDSASLSFLFDIFPLVSTPTSMKIRSGEKVWNKGHSQPTPKMQ